MKRNIEDNPLISIVMPVYNSPDLYASIDSVLSQTYPNIEFLIMDDASESFNKDEIDAYIAKNKEENIKNFEVKVHPENLGTVKTMNELFRKASGEYIFSLAGDDIFYDDYVIKSWVDYFIKSGVLISTAKFKVCDGDLNETDFVFPDWKKRFCIRFFSSKRLYCKMISGNFIFGCSTARSRECINRFGDFDERYKIIEDYPYHLSLLRRGGKIGLFNQVAVKHRAGGVSDGNNINSEYIMESDRIFENEILPFSNAKRSEKKYEHWKSGLLKRKSDYELAQEKWKDNRLMLDLIFIRFNFLKLVRNPRFAADEFEKRYCKKGKR